MTICIYCGKELMLRQNAEYNVERYGGRPLSATLCCNNPVRLFRTISIGCIPATTNENEDDWGNPFATNKESN